jgi:hypothetical protein
MRHGNTATTSIGLQATALSDHGMDMRREGGMCNFTACFPTLASRSNITFTDDSVVCLKMLSYILAKEITHLFETTAGSCIWNSAYYSFVDFGGIEDLFPSKHG